MSWDNADLGGFLIPEHREERRPNSSHVSSVHSTSVGIPSIGSLHQSGTALILIAEVLAATTARVSVLANIYF